MNPSTLMSHYRARRGPRGLASRHDRGAAITAGRRGLASLRRAWPRIATPRTCANRAIVLAREPACQWRLPGCTGKSTTASVVALAEVRARWTDKLGRVSDHEGQFGERLGMPGGRRHVGPESVEAPTEVLDEGVGSDDDPGGSISLQSSHGSKSGFEASVVGLDAVVRIHLGVVEGRRQQLIEDTGIDPVPVGGDLHW